MMKWNRGRYDPGLGHLSRTEPSRDEKRHAFEKFYKGWRDYMEGRPMFAPPNWDEATRSGTTRAMRRSRPRGQLKSLRLLQGRNYPVTTIHQAA